ncbi:MAG: hypothetical protein LBB45_00330 [Methanobrevibacter sp.]|jgi:hypothetical protein|nr:hypothetical protein [Candidatus Methanovirga basalitermitum]
MGKVIQGRVRRIYPKKEHKEFFSKCFRFSNRAWNSIHTMKLAYQQAKKDIAVNIPFSNL